MGTCGCGYTTDANKNCNGTHRVVQAVKADLAKELAANGFAEAAAFVKGENLPSPPQRVKHHQQPMQQMASG